MNSGPAVLHLSSLKPISRLDKLLTLMRLRYLLSVEPPVEEADGVHPAANLHHISKQYASLLVVAVFLNMVGKTLKKLKSTKGNRFVAG